MPDNIQPLDNEEIAEILHREIARFRFEANVMLTAPIHNLPGSSPGGLGRYVRGQLARWEQEENPSPPQTGLSPLVDEVVGKCAQLIQARLQAARTGEFTPMQDMNAEVEALRIRIEDQADQKRVPRLLLAYVEAAIMIAHSDEIAAFRDALRNAPEWVANNEFKERLAR